MPRVQIDERLTQTIQHVVRRQTLLLGMECDAAFILRLGCFVELMNDGVSYLNGHNSSALYLNGNGQRIVRGLPATSDA